MAAHRIVFAFVLLIGLASVSAEAGTLSSEPDTTASAPGSIPLLVLLTGGEETRDSLPVLRVHPDPEHVAARLERGFSGRFLRLYRYEQQYLARLQDSSRTNASVEPAYLWLSRNQGGFPRFGFFLGEEDKRGAGFVDLMEGRDDAGRFGARDQIFPHELAHVMVRQLAGPASRGGGGGGATVMHAVGVCTDPETAFQEGFAEHVQIMAVDDPEADPATAALARSGAAGQIARLNFAGYRRELSSRFAFASRLRMTFVLWFSGSEQALRYHQVKANAFAWEPEIPARLLRGHDPYGAWLLENTLPGEPGADPKSTARRLATEGVISAFFHEWVLDPRIQNACEDEEFYLRFGADRRRVTPLENTYLKLFHAFHQTRPQDTAAFIRGYLETFPEEALPVLELAGRYFPSAADRAPASAVPTIWLRNDSFRTGSSLFDQYRRLKQARTFDLNAAGLADLVSVPGVDLALAREIRAAGPYASVGDLERVPGVGRDLEAAFQRMAESAAAPDPGTIEARITLKGLLLSYVQRALLALGLASVLGTLVYRAVRNGLGLGGSRAAVAAKQEWIRSAGPQGPVKPIAPVGWVGSGARALAAALLALLCGWVFAAGIWVPLLAPVLVFGVPSFGISLLRGRSVRVSWRLLPAWLALALPAALLVRPWP